MKVNFKSVKDEKQNMADFYSLYESTAEDLENLKEIINDTASGSSIEKLKSLIEELIESHNKMKEKAEDHKISLEKYIETVLDAQIVTPVEYDQSCFVKTNLLSCKKEAIENYFDAHIQFLNRLDKPSKWAISPFLVGDLKENLENYIEYKNQILDSKKADIDIYLKNIDKNVSDINPIVRKIDSFEFWDLQVKQRENHTTLKMLSLLVAAPVAIVTVEAWAPVMIEAFSYEMISGEVMLAYSRSRGVAGKAFEVATKISNFKLGDTSIKTMFNSVLAINVFEDIMYEDNHFSVKEVFNDLIISVVTKSFNVFSENQIEKKLEKLEELGKLEEYEKLKKNKDKILGGLEFSSDIAAFYLDNYFDYDTDAYQQMNELEKKLEVLGVI